MRDIFYFAIQGGEDLMTPALTIDPGRQTFTKNYEVDQNGRLQRVDGLERYDGKPAPSDASYWTFNVTTGNGITPSSGDLVQGVTSGASGYVVSVSVTSGTFAGGDAVVAMIVSGISGTFQSGETVNVLSDQSTGLGSEFSSEFTSEFT